MKQMDPNTLVGGAKALRSSGTWFEPEVGHFFQPKTFFLGLNST